MSYSYEDGKIIDDYQKVIDVLLDEEYDTHEALRAIAKEYPSVFLYGVYSVANTCQWKHRVLSLVEEGKHIQAVKVTRECNPGMSLRTAKRICDAYRDATKKENLDD